MYQLLKIVLLTFLTKMASSTVSPPWSNWFPDLINVTWAHAVNSQTLLNDALTAGVRMVESDVVLGRWVDPEGHIQDTIIPILSHPPLLFSDLTLEHMFRTMELQNRTGIKLDFKTLEVAQTSRPLFSIYEPEVNIPGPLMVNADVLPGPGYTESNFTGVDGPKFLHLFKNLTETIFSLGWTTSDEGYDFETGYQKKHVDQMLQLIQNEKMNVSYVTFAVRSYLFSLKPSTFLPLLEQTKNATITLWHSGHDRNDDEVIQNLAGGINLCGIDRFLIDIPQPMKDKLYPLLNN